MFGGQSTSQLGSDARDKMVFSGVISTVGGGFASARTAKACKIKIPDTATFAKVVVEGDGQQYKLSLGQTHQVGESIWAHDLKTEKGVVKTFWLPLRKFSPTPKVNGLVLKPSELEYISIVLPPKDQNMQPNPHFCPGPFKVIVHEIEFL